MIVLPLLALASFTIIYAAFRRRYHCPHSDPLCRRNKPCIICYRELFKRGVDTLIRADNTKFIARNR
jgi:hypothetical protein